MGTNNKSNSDNKWWEFYFVRYFVGTVTGSIILLYLNLPYTSTISGLIDSIFKDQPSADSAKFLLIVAFGLAFCYIASAPILVFHATRASLFNAPHIRKRICVLLIVFASAALSAILAHCIFSGSLAAYTAAIMSIIFLLKLYFCILHFTTKQK